MPLVDCCVREPPLVREFEPMGCNFDQPEVGTTRPAVREPFLAILKPMPMEQIVCVDQFSPNLVGAGIVEA